MGENIVAEVDEYGERHLMHHLQEAGMDEEFHILYEEKVAEVIEWLEAHTKHIRWSAYNKEPDDYRPSIVLMRGLVVIGDLELGGIKIGVNLMRIDDEQYLYGMIGGAINRLCHTVFGPFVPDGTSSPVDSS